LSNGNKKNLNKCPIDEAPVTADLIGLFFPMENKKSYYAIIPANVRYSKKLKANEKLLYGEITALTNEKGFCYASNNYFANLYDVSKTSVSKWISSLEKNKFIRIKMTYKKGTKEIEQRKIYISPLLNKSSIPIEEKLNTPIEEKLKDIYNTKVLHINNKKKNNISTKSKTPVFDEIILKAFPHFVALFPDQYKPKSKAQKTKWLECLDKIQRIDNYDLREVYNVAKDLRNDDFWQTNFLSILKFRNKDKNGIKYIDRFMLNKASKERPKGFYNVKGIIDYFIYKSPANGLNELGAKTKGGDLYEFHIKQLMTTSEFLELKQYVQDANK
jgi:DNA-binding transcriptional ArsR family regulator